MSSPTPLDFRSALEAFIAGRIGLPQLEAALVENLRAEPHMASAHEGLVAAYGRVGRIPAPVAEQLATVFAAKPWLQGGPAAPPPPPAPSWPAPPPESDRTAFRVPPSAPPPPAPPQPPSTPPATSTTPPWPAPPPESDRTAYRGPPSMPRVPPPQAPPPAPPADNDRTAYRGAPSMPRVPPAVPPPPAGTMPGATTGTGTTTGSVTGTTTGGYTSTAGTGQPSTTSGTGTHGGTSSWSDIQRTAGGSPVHGAPLQAGSVLKERFVLESVLGKGGMGTVFKARDLRKEEAMDRNPHVAIKVLNEDFKAHPESLKALQRESRKAQDLAHPNILSVFDFDRDGANVYMVMELLEGDSLEKLIKQHENVGLEPKEALRIIRDLGKGLAYAHQRNIVHSDFKPSNAFLTKAGVIKVFDFGIARAAKTTGPAADTHQTVFDAGTLGALTYAYATPEMFEGLDPDQRDDLYALGIVAYELLTGRHPYNKKSAPEARDQKMKVKPVPGLNRRQNRALERALAFARADRQKNVDTFIDELMPKAVNKTVVGISVGAALLVAAVAAPQLWSLWADRRINAVARDIKTGDPAVIDQRIKEFETFTAEEQQKLLASKEVTDALAKYFEARITALIDTTRKDFDFTAASTLVTVALRVNPDSAKYNELKARVEDGRNQAINTFNSAIDDLLQKGRLLAAEGHDGVAESLEKLRRVNPDHPRLKDAQIVDAFTQQASAALERGDTAATASLIDSGLKYAPESSAARKALENLRDQLQARRSALEAASQVAQIEQELKPLTAETATLENFAAERQRIATLRVGKADSAVLAQLSSRLSALLRKRTDELAAARRHGEAQQLLEQYADLLPAEASGSLRASLEKSLAAYNERVGGILSALAKAAQAGNLEGAGSAAGLLKDLEQAGGTPEQLASSRDLIAKGYVAKSQQARARRAFDEARRYVDAGVAIKPSGSLLDLLQDERGQIAATESGAAKQQQMAEIQQLRAALAKALDSRQITIDDASTALQNILKLEGRGVRDATVSGARARLVTKLSDEATRLDASGATTEAASFAEAARALLPDAVPLQKLAATLKQKAATVQATAARNQQVKGVRADLDKTLAAARFDDAWDKQLQAGIDRLKALLPAGDAQLTAATEKVGRVYLARAGALRQGERFAEAEQLLDKARRYAPTLPGLETEARAIAQKKQEFAAKADAERAAGAVALLRQRILDKARGNEVAEATRLLDDFRTKYGSDPKNAAFVSNDGPLAIGQAYERTAARIAATGDFRQAVTVAQQAINAGPKGDRGLAEAGRVFGQLSSFAQTLDQGIRWQPERVRPLLASLEGRYPAAYAGMRAKLQERAQAGLSRRPPAEQETLRRLVQETFNPEAVKQTAAEPAKRDEPRPPPAAAAAPSPVTGGSGAAAPAAQPGAGGSTGAGTGPAAPAASGATTTAATPTGVTPAPGGGPTTAPAPGASGAGPRTGACQPERAGAGPRSLCSDAWTGGKGPSLMVIPAGGGSGSAFAMTRYEVRIDDVKAFCAEAGGCPSLTAPDGKYPVTTFSVKDAERYAAWLSTKTGETYRLPTDAEWTHAAKATGDGTDDNAWCIVRIGGTTKGESVASTQNGTPNAWGLSNMMGNVQEWAKSGGSWVAKGGSFNDRLADCRADTTKPHNGQPDGATGFRLLREIR